MKRGLVDRRWVHYLDLEYWNDGHLPTYSQEVQITPVKTLWTNTKDGKIKELSQNKIYKAIEVYHTNREPLTSKNDWDHKWFSRYILINDCDQIVEYYEKGTFTTIDKWRNKRIGDILK